MIAPRIAIAVALTWPLGAPAVDPAIGSETDSGKAAGVAGWTERQRHQTESFHGAQASETRGAGHNPARMDISGQMYRYGQREPVVEGLLTARRSPDT